MAYKKLIKVSNVCQLLDKSKFPATTTKSGITWTNNGDGTFTANGTVTDDYSTLIIANAIQIVKNHKYALIGGQGDNRIDSNLNLRNVNLSDYDGKYWGMNTRTATIDIAPASFIAFLWMDVSGNGYTADNITFKPKLFDLTEMYGAGHEPTTVEQFRQDFPEEMYDYSPHCWLTSYKRVIVTGDGNYLTTYKRNLTCKTKNLFDINSVTEVRHIRTGLLKPTTKWSIKNNSFITTLNNYSDGVSYILPTLSLEPGIYTFSAFCTSDYKYCWFGVYDFNKSKGFDEYYTTNKQLSKTFEITEKSDIGLIIQGYNKDFIGTFSDIQLEKGSTATDYVPYGHL